MQISILQQQLELIYTTDYEGFVWKIAFLNMSGVSTYWGWRNELSLFEINQLIAKFLKILRIKLDLS